MPTMQTSGDFEHEHLEQFLSWLSGWSTIHLMTGLLAHPPLVEALTVGTTLDELARESGLTDRQMTSLMKALDVEGLVTIEDGGIEFTDLGRSLERMRGWIELFTRGYAGLFRSTEEIFGGTIDPAGRDMLEVGRASIAISEHGALPMTIEAIERCAPEARVVMDVGCATGRFLIRLCEIRPDLFGLAVEPDPALAEAARQEVARAGLQHRIDVVQAAAQDHHPVRPVDVIVFAFVLQEVLEQTSRAELIDVLRALSELNRTAVFVVVEVDAAGWDVDRIRDDPHRRGYYAPYFLLHDLTEQRLLAVDEWTALFEEAGLAVEEVLRVDPAVDPTGLEVAFVVKSV